MFKKPFSFEGRIRRLEYGLSALFGTILFYVLAGIIGLGAVAAGASEDTIIIPMLIIYIPFLWFMWAQGAKRCHDLGNSGWFQLIPFYSLWMLFKDGEYGENNYGVNPKTGKVNDFNADNILDEGL
jgi:uncharacterized membrane protein YhaH (DUF805 family)